MSGAACAGPLSTSRSWIALIRTLICARSPVSVVAVLVSVAMPASLRGRPDVGIRTTARRISARRVTGKGHADPERLCIDQPRLRHLESVRKQSPATTRHHRVREQSVLVHQPGLDQRVAQRDAAGHHDATSTSPWGSNQSPSNSMEPSRVIFWVIASVRTGNLLILPFWRRARFRGCVEVQRPPCRGSRPNHGGDWPGYRGRPGRRFARCRSFACRHLPPAARPSPSRRRSTAGVRSGTSPPCTMASPGSLARQDRTLARNVPTAPLNSAGRCSGAKWLTPGRRTNSAPGMLPARYAACSGRMNSSCSP